MGVDALGVADASPAADDPVSLLPKLTTAMVARIQGWDDNEYRWTFTGRKTTTYRQIGNAFPPPVARALGEQVRLALDHKGMPRDLVEQSNAAHDPVYAVLRDDGGFLTMDQIVRRLAEPMGFPPSNATWPTFGGTSTSTPILARRAMPTAWATSRLSSAKMTTCATTCSLIPPRSAEDPRYPAVDRLRLLPGVDRSLAETSGGKTL